MILYLTYCDDGYKRLHKNLENKRALHGVIKVKLFYVTKKDLNEKWVYFSSYPWWREK